MNLIEQINNICNKFNKISIFIMQVLLILFIILGITLLTMGFSGNALICGMGVVACVCGLVINKVFKREVV